MNEIEFVSIGGWCGTKMALTRNNIFAPSNPFDYVRSSIIGVIDCLENDFANFFPKEKIKQEKGFYLSKCCEFQHEDFDNQETIDSFNRKITRFKEVLSKKTHVCFLRTVCLNDYENELKYYKTLQNAIEKLYPHLKYIICFIITKQNYLSYCKNLDDKTFVFAINNKLVFSPSEYLQGTYKYIIDFIVNENLFLKIPVPIDIELIKSDTRLEVKNLFHE